MIRASLAIQRARKSPVWSLALRRLRFNPGLGPACPRAVLFNRRDEDAPGRRRKSLRLLASVGSRPRSAARASPASRQPVFEPQPSARRRASSPHAASRNASCLSPRSRIFRAAAQFICRKNAVPSKFWESVGGQLTLSSARPPGADRQTALCPARFVYQSVELRSGHPLAVVPEDDVRFEQACALAGLT